MSETHCFVSQTGTVMAECPECGKSTLIPVDQFKGKKCTLKIKCGCHHIFSLILDFRKHCRKKTLLEGSYRKINVVIKSPNKNQPCDGASAGKNRGQDNKPNCTIQDISVGGIGLDIWGPHTLEEGDVLFIEFELDNKKKSLLRREVTVRTVEKNYVGAQFSDQMECQSDLAFYLWS